MGGEAASASSSSTAIAMEEESACLPQSLPFGWLWSAADATAEYSCIVFDASLDPSTDFRWWCPITVFGRGYRVLHPVWFPEAYQPQADQGSIQSFFEVFQSSQSIFSLTKHWI